jgi:Fe-S cluster assembly protein SufB
LIIADVGAYVSYLEGCTAPQRDENQLHAAVAEPSRSTMRRSNIQLCRTGIPAMPRAAAVSTTRHEAWRYRQTFEDPDSSRNRLAITRKYPSRAGGDDSVGEFHSAALTNNYQQADTGTKMIHLGRNTRSTILSKGISAGRSQNSIADSSVFHQRRKARDFTQCDSLLIGDRCGAHTFPYIETSNPGAVVEHEATTSKVGDDQLFLCQQRGIDPEHAVSMIVNGFCKDVFRELPMEFAVEAGKLRSQPRRSRRMNSAAPLLEVENLHVSVAGEPILKGLTLTASRRSRRDHGPNGSARARSPMS